MENGNWKIENGKERFDAETVRKSMEFAEKS
jgi:hypothetical protein